MKKITLEEKVLKLRDYFQNDIETELMVSQTLGTLGMDILNDCVKMAERAVKVKSVKFEDITKKRLLNKFADLINNADENCNINNTDCSLCTGCNNCTKCVECYNCSVCTDCHSCKNCDHCYRSYNCTNSSSLLLCYGLTDKQSGLWLLNEKVDTRTFDAALNAVILGD